MTNNINIQNNNDTIPNIMKLSKILVHVVLFIGILFNTFHDFVFYKIDPCMSKIEIVIKPDKLDKKDPFCKIHNELHKSFILTYSIRKFDSKPREEKNFFYQKPSLKLYSIKIFKPPKQSA